MIRLTDVEQIQVDLEECEAVLSDIFNGITQPKVALTNVKQTYEKYVYEYVEYRKYLAKLKRKEEAQQAEVKSEIVESFGQQYKQLTLDDVIELNLADGTLTIKQLTNNE